MHSISRSLIHRSTIVTQLFHLFVTGSNFTRVVPKNFVYNTRCHQTKRGSKDSVKPCGGFKRNLIPVFRKLCVALLIPTLLELGTQRECVAPASLAPPDRCTGRGGLGAGMAEVFLSPIPVTQRFQFAADVQYLFITCHQGVTSARFSDLIFEINHFRGAMGEGRQPQPQGLETRSNYLWHCIISRKIGILLNILFI